MEDNKNVNETATENKDIDQLVIDDTNKDTQKQVDAFEKLDKQSEKQKKRLRRKVRIRNGVILGLIIVIIILLLRGCSSGVGVNFRKGAKQKQLISRIEIQKQLIMTM